MKTTTKTERFYQNDHFQTESGERGHISIFRNQLFPLAQIHGDTQAAANILATDVSKTVIKVTAALTSLQISYTPYGHNPNTCADETKLGFAGQLRENLENNYLLGNGYRAFNPNLMRFNSPDNHSPFSKGGINSYAYCASDPVNRSDPSGHMYNHHTGKTYPGLHKMMNLASPAQSFLPPRTLSTSTASHPKTKRSNISTSLVGSPLYVSLGGSGSKNYKKMTASRTVKMMLDTAETEAWRIFHPPQAPRPYHIKNMQYLLIGSELEDLGLIHAAEYAYGFANSVLPGRLKKFGVPKNLQESTIATWETLNQKTEAEILDLLANEIRTEFPSTN
ncbi:RHS repeat-associated core domain-containing protein [Pseudomonas phoenicis]|uniref:RHS repeat-associated core domain-containing protein n=1 Tax=unclassified Pseudomonas TaxID=196821 RepID=UPI0039A16F70